MKIIKTSENQRIQLCKRLIAAIFICSLIVCQVNAEDLADAVTSGKVGVRLLGTGGSSGDSVRITVSRTGASGEDLNLSVTPGTRLQSSDSSAQSMVIARVRGRVVDAIHFAPTDTIEVTATPATYILEAYCADFEKNNPSNSTRFSVRRVDPVLQRILEETSGLSIPAKQAAVWIYTDHVTYSHVNEKFRVSRSEWEAALAAVKRVVQSQGNHF